MLAVDPSPVDPKAPLPAIVEIIPEDIFRILLLASSANTTLLELSIQVNAGLKRYARVAELPSPVNPVEPACPAIVDIIFVDLTTFRMVSASLSEI